MAEESETLAGSYSVITMPDGTRVLMSKDENGKWQPASYSAKLRSRLFLCYLTLSGDLDSAGTEEAAVNPEMRESYQHAAARLLHDEVIAQGLNATHEQCYQVILNLRDKEAVLYGEGDTVDRLASVAAVLVTRLLTEKEQEGRRVQAPTASIGGSAPAGEERT